MRAGATGASGHDPTRTSAGSMMQSGTETPADVDIVREFPDTSWGKDDTTRGPTRGVESSVESGLVLSFPHLPFVLDESERRFLDPRWADPAAKNVSVRWPSGELRGALGDSAETEVLRHMIVRYAEQSEAFALRLFPHYRGHLRRGNTSFRPVDVAGRELSWRKDDTRLHVDAFPSNPMDGTRLLRVFSNVHPGAEPRRWRVGEPFDAHAARYLPAITRPWHGSARLLHALGITKRRRTEYDHVMLHLHDFAKADAAFQQSSPQRRVDFAPGTTWVVFSDQVLHAAMGGQHMMEQTFMLEVEAQLEPARSPLRTLERLLERPLR